MNASRNELQVAKFADVRENEKYPVFVDGKMMLAKFDKTGQIVGPMEPVDNPGNLFGRPVMYVVNEGPGVGWLELVGQTKELMSPGQCVLGEPQSLAIDIIDGESASIEVSCWLPDQVGGSLNATPAPSINGSTAVELGKKAKVPKWKVSQLYKSVPRQFEVLAVDDCTCAIVGAPNPEKVAEKYAISLMMILNDGPGGTTVKASGKNTITLGANRAIFVIAGRTEVGMIEGQSAHLSVNIFSNPKYRISN